MFYRFWPSRNLRPPPGRMGWLAACLWGLFSATAYSQPYRFIHLGEAAGLGNPNVTDLFQDRYGFVWIGTKGGLYRFDGYDCVLFEHKPGDSTSLPSNAIAFHAFHEEDNGDLWIATADAGFARFDRRSERFERFQVKPGDKADLTFNAVEALCGDGAGGLWIASKGGFRHFSPERDSFSDYLAPDENGESLTGNAMCRTRDGRLWIGTLYGVAVFGGPEKFRRYAAQPRHPGSLSADFVTDIFEDKKGRIWVATENGLNRWVTRDSFVQYYPAGGLQAPNSDGYNYILCVYEDRDGDFWLGANGGLMRFNPERGTFEAVRHDPLDLTSIRKGPVRGILEDHTGRLWFATAGGASVLDKKTALLQDDDWAPVQAQLEAAGGGALILDLAQTGDRFWLSNENGLFTFRPGETVRRFLPGTFYRLFVDSRGRLWAGTLQEHLFVIDPGNLRVTERILKIPSQKPRSHTQPVGLLNSAFAEDRGGFFWIGTYMTLNRYDPAKNRYRQFYPKADNPHSLSHSTINDLRYDRRGTLWIATEGGLNYLLPEELEKPIEDTLLLFHAYFHNPRDANSISNDRIRCILEDHQGRMWFGTDVGLNLLHPDGRWQRFFREDGLPDNYVNGLLEDSAGHIWATTQNNGLARYDPASGRFLHLTQQDGLDTDQFLTGAHLKTGHGRLVFAGYGGVNGFDPRAVAPRRDTLPLCFVGLKLNNRLVRPGDGSGLLVGPLYLTREITLGFDSKVVTLSVAALNAPNPQQQVYRYRLDGFWAPQGWINLGTRREITFTNLFPGRYTLRVESTARPDERAHWESATTLIVRVRFPWVRFLAVAAALLAVFYTIYKLRVNRKLAAAEARRLSELDTVKTRLYTNITHEFRTPLTVILGEAARLEKRNERNEYEPLTAIRRQGGRLLHLVNQMLDLAKVEAGSLPVHWVQGNVVLFLKYLLESFRSLAESKRIELRFEPGADEFWMDYDPDKLQKIVANLLSNAVKFTPPGGRVTLHVAPSAGGQTLTIRVADTGPGIPPESLPFVFDRFYQADNPNTRAGEGTGIGLTLTREMIRLLGGTIRVDSRPGEGAVFTAELPVGRTAEKQATPVVDLFAEDEVPEPETPAAGPSAAGRMFLRSPDARPRLLLVEDNVDVVRYLSSLLAPEYRIHMAPNGKAGVETAFRLVPDLVVSDVMMPEMDGFDACRTLKTDFRTSHIPVILLTAKADLDSRIEGLEHGADAYLSKPFEERELRAHLRKLHELRLALRERYAGFGPLVPSDNPAFRREDGFFNELHTVLEKKFADPAFGVPELCKALNKSRPSLYRKLTALTGKNIEVYLRSFRLRKAYDMLQNTGEPVIQIGFNCSFEDPAHFSRVFHAEFGFPPSRLRS